MKKLLMVLAIPGLLISCTDNQRTRRFGGTEEIKLEKNHVLINVTWKYDDIWICTKDTVTGIVYFKEKSSWGVMEGTIIFK